MKYGTYEMALKYDKQGKIAEWLQLFLRNDGHNTALAEGLLREERCYIGLRQLPLALLDGIKSGAPEYLRDQDSIEYFFQVVDKMKQAHGSWDIPPLIVEYVENRFQVNDGRHRLEMYRQMGIAQAPAVLWTTGEPMRDRLLKLLEESSHNEKNGG
ncbi:MAG: ParB N-terminal domain-containing protein [Lachnospiraceae bacterium]|nr:ParB N-terminal domain-containing protein [Lachnospiraceae bacterium]